MIAVTCPAGMPRVTALTRLARPVEDGEGSVDNVHASAAVRRRAGRSNRLIS